MTIPSVLFVLPVSGGGGGANSVVQEVMGLAQLGVDADIAVDAENHVPFISAYPELAQLRIAVRRYADAVELARSLEAVDVAIATTNHSIASIREARADIQARHGREPRIAYYIQDYEPLFYAPNSDKWRTAYESYAALGDATLFAKTDWLRNIVYENHAIRVHKVSPSIDHDIYYPNLGRQVANLSIVAMLRPQTPRRAPKRTLRILEMLADQLEGGVSLQVFGADLEALDAVGLGPSPRIACHGVLRRHQVPQLLRAADMFLDLSDYQAFGRTGLESMACACVPVVPILGGTAEYAVHLHNCYVVDTRSDEAIVEAVRHFSRQTEEERTEMRHNALETAANFTIIKAALSELRLFRSMMSGL